MYLPTQRDVGKKFKLAVLDDSPVKGKNGTYTVEDDQIVLLQDTVGRITRVTDSNVYFTADGEEDRFGTLRIKKGQVKLVFLNDEAPRVSAPVKSACHEPVHVNVSKGENVMNTVKKLGNIVFEGVKIHSSGDAAKKLVELAKAQLGDSYPAFLKTELGETLAPSIIPAVIFAVADNYGAGNATMQKAKKVAEYALLGASKDIVDYVNKLLPLFTSVAALSTFVLPQD